jgi:hypothetical protein
VHDGYLAEVQHVSATLDGSSPSPMNDTTA